MYNSNNLDSSILSSSSCSSSLGGRRRSCHDRPVRARVGSVVQAQSSNALASLGCLGVIPRPRPYRICFSEGLSAGAIYHAGKALRHCLHCRVLCTGTGFLVQSGSLQQSAATSFRFAARCTAHSGAKVCQFDLGSECQLLARTGMSTGFESFVR